MDGSKKTTVHAKGELRPWVDCGTVRYGLRRGTSQLKEDDGQRE